jgi:hypothetical protein
VREEQGLRFISAAVVIDLTVSLIYTKFSNSLASHCSQSLSILIGNLAMITLGSLLLITSNQSLGRNKRIIGYLILHGVSRAVYESNMKAVMADAFMDYESTLFLILANTFKMVSCGAAYLIYALLIHERLVYAEVVISLSLLALFGYLLSLTLSAPYLAISREESPSDVSEDYSAPSIATGKVSGSSGGPSLGGVLTATTLPMKRERGALNDMLLPRVSSTSSLNSEMMFVPEYF